ncbi:MAG: hypothetical protein BGO12_15345 [Verrucomicrobia bacterium 61-8]|nr:hypothetical protein [Verrucomicrobiota bacterium]OJV03935.1 MAG: hypothetical protein BGO12_15345 [Verrucomicrobia bacterium 61-8]
MQTSTRKFIAIALSALFVMTAKSAEEKQDQPKVEVVASGWSVDGQLVLGVKITAAKSRPLELGKAAKSSDQTVSLFTTKESWLKDVRTGGRIPASRRFPNKPNYGWIKSAETIAPGDSREFTAAFPAPPLPPVVNGKRQDYQLELHLPGELPPVTFRVPVPAELSRSP